MSQKEEDGDDYWWLKQLQWSDAKQNRWKQKQNSDNEREEVRCGEEIKYKDIAGRS